MDTVSLWLDNPAAAYREWQAHDAAGADRRPFAARSVVQHTAMFDRFLRYLVARGTTVAAFDAAHLESFFADVDNRCAPGTTTHVRYAKLVDRLCRYLVELGVRRGNPAADFVRKEQWPEDEPQPLFLDPAADERLQSHIQPQGADNDREARNRAIVALLLGTGITAGEIRVARAGHLVIDAVRPHIFVPKRGARAERKVTLQGFAIAALERWLLVSQCDEAEQLLFPAPKAGKPINDMLLGIIVREALEAVDFCAPDMSPRILRNTYARRQLLSGRNNEDVSRLLGLVSQRTVVRLRATIQPVAIESSDTSLST
ncbi:tyrosine-type recombinase/integrase [Paraburkholderia sp. GAS334]|uniref:tyrosine-type recombinase/integrase n=1 Tax=Paraburkholderia sp. GAS334 TaxID=3035131 RepID=UPI003D1FC5DC